jgi:predicted outer membrane protein
MRRGLVAAAVAGALLAGPAATMGSSAEVPSGLDQQYLTTAIKGDVWEIASGKLAQRMGHDARVQALGRQVELTR